MKPAIENVAIGTRTQKAQLPQKKFFTTRPRTAALFFHVVCTASRVTATAKTSGIKLGNAAPP